MSSTWYKLLMISAAVAVAGLSAAAALAGREAASTGQRHSATPAELVVEATTIVANARQAPAFRLPGKAFNVSSVKGKKVWLVTFAKSFPLLEQWRKLAQRELERLGAKVTVFDGKSDASEWVRGVQQAVAAKPNLIITLAIPTALVGAQVREATKRGIKVVTVIGASGIPGKPKVAGVSADVTYDYRIPGKLIAAWFAAQSKGKGNALLIAAKGNPSADTGIAGMQTEIARLCPGCKTRLEDAQPPTWYDGTLQKAAKSYVQADPGITHVLPIFDAMTIGVDAGLTELGLKDKISQASFNASLDQMKQLKAGSSSLKVDIGGSNEWFAMSMADTALRVLTGSKPIFNHKIGFRIFDNANTQGIDVTSEKGAAWYGVNFIKKYRTLWLRK